MKRLRCKQNIFEPNLINGLTILINRFPSDLIGYPMYEFAPLYVLSSFTFPLMTIVNSFQSRIS